MQTNRRSLLGGALALPAVSIAMPARARGGISPELSALIATADEASAASDLHYETVWEPLDQRVQAAIEALPHTTVDAGLSMGGGRVIWSTAKPASVATTRTIVAMAREGKDMASAGLVQARFVTAAHLRRERASARIRRDNGVQAAIERDNELSDLSADAQCEVARFPVSTSADLAAKLAFMIERQLGNGMDWLEELHADARRIAKMEG
jgi:hypothetical protein